MATVNAVLAPSLYPSIFDPSSGGFLVGGTISWFATDMITPKPVYPSPDTTGSPYPNPYTLDSIAAEPPMYYLTDEPYWIEIRQATPAGCACAELDPIYSFFFYPNSNTPSSQTQQVYNFISNGQFLWPIIFNTPDQDQSKIYIDGTTAVCVAWKMDVDNTAENDVDVFFESVLGASVSGHPANLIHVKVNDVGATMTKLDLVTGWGRLNELSSANGGEIVTLSLVGSAVTGSPIVLEIIISQQYNVGDIIETLVGTITLPTGLALPTQSLIFTMPPIESAMIIDTVLNQTVLKIRGPLLTPNIEYRFTDIQIEEGSVMAPAYVQEPFGVIRARGFSQDFSFPSDDVAQNTQQGMLNYERLTLVNNNYHWVANTGTFKPVPVSALPPDMLFIDGQSLNVQDYVNGIPLQRLYNVFGTQFGGVADIVASTNGTNIITAGSPVGAREFSAWTAGSSGFTVTQTVIGFKLGVSAALTTGSTTSTDITFLDNFAPQQSSGLPSGRSLAIPTQVIGNGFYLLNTSGGTYYGSQAITVTTVDAGSGSTQAIGRVAFSSSIISGYQTQTPSLGGGQIATANFLEFAALSNNFRGNYTSYTPPSRTNSPMCILFSVDGVINNGLPAEGTQAQITVPFLSTLSLAQNVQVFINNVNNPFVYTITVGALPAASSDFLFSSSTTNYYVWFTINGTGTDPAVPGRTGILCALLSSDTPITAAQKIAVVMRSATFSLPTQADLVALGNANIKWAVYL